MVLSETINVRVNGRTKQRYKDLGYDVNKVGDIINIKYTDLSKYSGEFITVKCDYCGKVFSRKYSDHYRIMNSGKGVTLKDACNNCKVLKTKETMQSVYGVDSNFQLDFVQEKIHETLRNKYGVETNISQSKVIQETITKNNLEKYGVKSASMLQATKDKVKATNLKKFGAEYPIQSDVYREYITSKHLKEYGWEFPFSSFDIRQKASDSLMINYGVESPFCSDIIKDKANQSKYQNGSQACSKQQFHLSTVLHGVINYPFLRYFIDIAFPEEKIAIEYNGGGHDLSVKLGNITKSKFIQNETFRKKQLYKNEWKLITYISPKNKLLNDDESILTYKYALQVLNSGRHWVEIDIDNKKIITSQNIIDITQISLND